MKIRHPGTLVLVLLASFAFNTAIGWSQTLLVIEPSKEQPRNSEGDMIELKDGRLCLIYTRFTGGGEDADAADLAMRTSRDGGKTWSDDRIVVRHEGGLNVMSVSLLRLADGRIALFYGRKVSWVDSRPIMRISDDEGRTWSEPTVCITDRVGYYTFNNDRAVQLADGRIVLPVSLYNLLGDKEEDQVWSGRLMCYLSDDVGKTWQRGKIALLDETPAGKKITLQEPGVVVLTDGRLMMFCRTDAGSQYISYSEDDGETWSPLEPSKLASPVSPATIKRIPWSGELLCVWNDHSGVHPFSPGRRAPLCMAISRDEGRTWSQSHVIEPDPDGWYCYTSVMFQQDRMLLSYCAGNKKDGTTLNRLKVVALSKDQIQQVALKTRKRQAPTARLVPCLDIHYSMLLRE